MNVRSKQQYYRVQLIALTVASLPLAWIYSYKWGIVWVCAIMLMLFVLQDVEKHGE